MKKDTIDMMNAFGRAVASRQSFLRDTAVSRREFLRNSSLLAAGFAAAGTGTVIRPRVAHAADWSLAEAAKPYAGTTVRISNLAGYPHNDFMRQFVPDFEKETGIKVTIDTVQYGEAVGKHMQLLATGSDEYDLYNIDSIWFPGYAPYMEPLTSFMADSNLSDPNFNYNDLSAECQKTNSYLDEVYMFSNMFTFPILAYRKDWYAEAGLKAPVTWKELYDQAAQFTKGDHYGYVIHGLRTAMMEMVTIPFLSMGGTVFDDYLHPTFSQPPENFENAKHAMQIIRDIYQNKITPPGSLDFELGEASAAYSQGNIAMNLNWAIIFAVQEDPKQSKVAGKNAYAWPPTGFDTPAPNGEVTGGYTRLASFGLAIAKSSANKEAAFLFSQWLSSPAIQEKILQAGDAAPSRVSLLEKYKDKYGHFPILLESTKLVGKKLWDAPKIANERQWEDTVAIAFQDCMIGKTNVEDAIVTADKEVGKLMKQYGFYQGDKEYPKTVTSNYKGTPKVELL
ncbi:ABC transporter substrate-binding protein [Aestuariivirga sp.]|uniref:ABC transporter substrate-binding protein n=1 Tax=Aestuariivirga sp. TaxID=2650926 RepID=UPI0039E45BC8